MHVFTHSFDYIALGILIACMLLAGGFPQTPLTELLRRARHPFELQDQPQGSHSIIDVAAAGRKLALRARPICSDLARNLHIPADYGGCRSKRCAGWARLSTRDYCSNSSNGETDHEA